MKYLKKMTGRNHLNTFIHVVNPDTQTAFCGPWPRVWNKYDEYHDKLKEWDVVEHVGPVSIRQKFKRLHEDWYDFCLPIPGEPRICTTCLLAWWKSLQPPPPPKKPELMPVRRVKKALGENERWTERRMWEKKLEGWNKMFPKKEAT